MKRTFFDVKAAVTWVLCIMTLFSLVGYAVNSGSELNDNSAPLPNTAVQIISMDSDTEESSYQVGTVIPGAAFSSVSQVLEDEIAQEWKTYDDMTEEAKMLSSHYWGIVYFEADTWDEFEETIGFSVYNPLESLSRLNKTGYMGMESVDPGTPIKHIEVTVNTANAERKLSEISAACGYYTENVRITLTAALLSDAGTYTTGCACKGYVTFNRKTTATGNGIPVLIVLSDGTNNAGYYEGDYYDAAAYWVKDNVFYTLRVFGNAADKSDIQTSLDRILADI